MNHQSSTIKSDNCLEGPIYSTLVQEDPGFAPLIEDFLQAIPETLAILVQTNSTKKLPEVASLAHKIKGTGGGYGFQILTDLGAKLEIAAKADNQEECDQLVREIAAIIARFQPGVATD